MQILVSLEELVNFEIGIKKAIDRGNYLEFNKAKMQIDKLIHELENIKIRQHMTF